MKPTFSTLEVITITEQLTTVHEFRLLAGIVIEEKKRYSLNDLRVMASYLNRKFNVVNVNNDTAWNTF